MSAPPLFLAADVGGTNCRLALQQGDRITSQATFTTDNRSFEEVVRSFLGDQVPSAACVAVAGPVKSGRARMTHHSWAFDEVALCAALGCPTLLVNDFQAATRGVVSLGPDQLRTLSGPPPDSLGTVVALGPGTGLGVGWMVHTATGWLVSASEGGHQDLAPNNPREAALWAWLHDRHDHVSWERVLSGPGLVTLHDFSVLQGHAGLDNPDPAAIGSSQTPACLQARMLFASLLGHFAGNLALHHLPSGGLWICGGVTPRLAEPAFEAALVEAFLAKGRFLEQLKDIPLALVTTPDLGLRGATAFARGLVPSP